MAESQPTSHTDLMKLRAKGKQLHRRTQSHTTFSLNEVANKKNNSDEFFQEMLHSHNTPNGDLTQKVLDAVQRQENEIEVIVDDIDEVPNTGIIVPQALTSGLHNPMSGGIQRRNLLLRNNLQGNNSQFKKIDMLSQVRNIDDITGLGTIHEKRNSMESIDTENMNKRSPNMTNSGSSSQNISKTVSRAHSKHPSLDFRVGHSNSSSVDFRPMHSKQSSGDMWSLHSKQSSADFRPTHSKQSSADFRPLGKDSLGLGIRAEKEIDVIKYNLLSPKAVKTSETPQYGANLDYFDKRNRFISDLQKSSIDKVKRESSGPEHVTTKATTSKADDTKAKQRLSSANTNTLDRKDKAKVTKAQTAPKHRRTYSGNVGKPGEATSPREDLALSAMFLTAKNTKEPAVHENAQGHGGEVHHHEVNTAPKEQKKGNVDDSMKKLANKTDVLEGQIKNIFNIIESFANEKAQLEEKIQTQDQKIKELMSLTTRYQEEIKMLKGKSEHKTGREHERKPTSNKGESGGLNILTSTEGSAFDSSLTESSGFLSNKDNRIKQKATATFSSTPIGQNKFHTMRNDERKSPAIFGTKSEIVTKKPAQGTKKPTLKKV